MHCLQGASFPTQGEPASDPDILYLFPGLQVRIPHAHSPATAVGAHDAARPATSQNIDWIPLHDPEPSDPFDIIQPVLQYPADTGGACVTARLCVWVRDHIGRHLHACPQWATA